MRITIRSIVGGVAIAALIGASVTAQADARPVHLVKLHGHVTGAGKAVAGGQVIISAWPNAETLSKYKNGQAIPVVTVGYGRTDASGNFSFDEDTGNLDARYSDPNGDLSLEYQVLSGDSLADYTAHSPRGGDQALDMDVKNSSVSESTTRLVASGGLSVARVLAQPKVSKTSKLAVVKVKPSASKGLFKPSIVAPVCTHTQIATLSKKAEFFTTVWTDTGIPATIQEIVGSTRTTGVGVSASATLSGLNFKASGTSTWSTNATNTDKIVGITLPTHIGDDVNYAEYKDQCLTTTSYSLKSIGKFSLLTESIINTDARDHVAAKRFPTCSPISYNHLWGTATNTTQTYTGGVALGFISLDASHGWNKEVSINWDGTGRYTVQCYDSTLGLSGAKEMEVHGA